MKQENKRKILNGFKKYSLISIMIIYLIVRIILGYCRCKDVDDSSIIISLTPIIITIIVIRYSLPKENGNITYNEYKEIKGGIWFELKEIIFIILLTFSLYTIAYSLRYQIYIWHLDAATIIYLLLFIHQELPLITNIDKKIDKKIKSKNFNENKDNKKSKQNKSLEKEIIDKYILNKIFTNGLTNTFYLYKSDNINENQKLLKEILDLNNIYLRKLFFKIDGYKGSDISDFNNLNISDLIIKSIDNFYEIFLIKDFYLLFKLNDYDDKNLELLVDYLILLKDISEKKSLPYYFNIKIMDIFNSFSFKINEKTDYKEFKFRFLLKLIFKTVSKNETWGLKLFNYSGFLSKSISEENKYFLYFISIYLYYLIEINERVNDSFKNELKDYLYFKSDGFYSTEESFDSLLVYLYNFNKSFNMLNLLDNLRKIRNYEKDLEMYLYPIKNGSSYTFTPFDINVIIDCWIQIILCNTSNNNDDVINKINILTQQEKGFLVSSINNFKNSDYTRSYITFFKFRIKDEISIYLEINKKLIEDIENKVIKSFDNNTVKSEDSEKIIDKNIEQINKKISQIDIYDKKLPLDDAIRYRFNSIILKDEDISELFIEYVQNIIIENFQSQTEELEKIYNSDSTTKAIQNQYITTKNYNELWYKIDNKNKNKVIEIIKLGKSNTNLNDFVMWEKGSITFNIKCEKSKSIYREISDYEFFNYFQKNNPLCENFNFESFSKENLRFISIFFTFKLTTNNKKIIIIR